MLQSVLASSPRRDSSSPPAVVRVGAARLPSWGVSLPVALMVSAGFLWLGQGGPLPASLWAAAFLFLALEQDLRRSRIPNWLSIAGLCVALGLAGWNGGVAGVGIALLAAGIAMATLFVPFALGVLGAGDVKAMMVLAAFWGIGGFFPVLYHAVLAGGVLALLIITVRGELPNLVLRWSAMLGTTLTQRRWSYFPPEAGSAAAGSFPFTLAIALGTLAYQLWGTQWL